VILIYVPLNFNPGNIDAIANAGCIRARLHANITVDIDVIQRKVSDTTTPFPRAAIANPDSFQAHCSSVPYSTIGSAFTERFASPGSGNGLVLG
jgi:hypothetical protein